MIFFSTGFSVAAMGLDASERLVTGALGGAGAATCGLAAVGCASALTSAPTANLPREAATNNGLP